MGNRRSLSLFLFLLLAAGCKTNYYEEHYTDLGDPLAGTISPSQSSEVKIRPVISRDDLIHAIEEGYLPIGESSFTGPHIPWRQAVDLAQEKGCDLLLLEEVFQTTEKKTSLLHVPTTDYYYTYGPRYAYDHRGRPIYAHYPEIISAHRTQVIPYTQSIKHYQQTALFLRKMECRNFYGVLLSIPPRLPGSDPEAPCKATVLAVLRGSQAEKDGIKRGSAIKKINGKEVRTRLDLMPFQSDPRAITSVEVTR